MGLVRHVTLHRLLSPAKSYAADRHLVVWVSFNIVVNCCKLSSMKKLQVEYPPRKSFTTARNVWRNTKNGHKDDNAIDSDSGQTFSEDSENDDFRQSIRKLRRYTAQDVELYETRSGQNDTPQLKSEVVILTGKNLAQMSSQKKSIHQTQTKIEQPLVTLCAKPYQSTPDLRDLRKHCNESRNKYLSREIDDEESQSDVSKLLQPERHIFARSNLNLTVNDKNLTTPRLISRTASTISLDFTDDYGKENDSPPLKNEYNRKYSIPTLHSVRKMPQYRMMSVSTFPPEKHTAERPYVVVPSTLSGILRIYPKASRLKRENVSRLAASLSSVAVTNHEQTRGFKAKPTDHSNIPEDKCVIMQEDFGKLTSCLQLVALIAYDNIVIPGGPLRALVYLKVKKPSYLMEIKLTIEQFHSFQTSKTAISNREVRST
ncbi:hypothetical protein EG68_05808 [Paragonimus skrjabini miyazakii]|uniref:Uncharacterized protein n=1 Tax=Paragonimus skrjabini miyazakii TaxID=59628 RepID=A0A8S9YWB4_9TREM|nr:hypothetical protein EG68_05808 [Paragonimus skrjabini miyazakii]